MLRFRFFGVCVLSCLGWAAASSTASAQERLDSSIRAWADVGIYSGELFLPGTKVTSITPVLRGEFELSSFQLGLDLPLAIGATSISSDLLAGDVLEGGGSGARFGNPTLHLDYVVEPKPFRAAVGLALAISTSSDDDITDADALAAQAGAGAGAFGRGLWNAWWYTTTAWGLIVPASVEYDTDAYEVGGDAALAWLLVRGANRQNEGVFQIGGHAAGVFGVGVLGLRLNAVLGLDDRFIGPDHLQLSVEPYAELRLPIVWFGLGINLPLDEPLGILGDGADFWNLRISGGARF